MKRMNGETERVKRKRAAEEERGLAGLPVPPVSWDYLLLQSTVAQQKQREQQNYTHLPHYLMYPTTVHLSHMVIWLFLVLYLSSN